MKKTIFILSLVMLFGLFSCEKDEIDPGMAPNSTLAGSWSVKEYDLDMNELYGPSIILTYNTSSDADSIWIDNIYDSGIKMKAHVVSETTFQKTGGINITPTILTDTISTINISEAAILSDSIIFRVTLYNVNGVTLDDYYEAGHRTTGWEGDRHE